MLPHVRYNAVQPYAVSRHYTDFASRLATRWLTGSRSMERMWTTRLLNLNNMAVVVVQQLHTMHGLANLDWPASKLELSSGSPTAIVPDHRRQIASIDSLGQCHFLIAKSTGLYLFLI
jgi:hypothetical protein